MGLDGPSMNGKVSSTGLGIASALVAWVAFSLNDLGIKYLSGDYPLHQIVLVRTLVALTITLLILVPYEGGYANLKTKFIGIHIIRGLCIVLANSLFFIGLASITLAEATAIFFIAPLFITALSVIFLNEKVGIYRWSAVVVGLIGVIVMLRPGSSAFQYASLLPLLAALAYAITQILTRKIGFKDKASTMAFYIQLGFVFVCTGFGVLFGDGQYASDTSASLDFLLRAWVWPEQKDLLIMMATGVSSGVGGYLISQAYRVCEAVVIAPFEYIALVMSVVWSVLVFSEWPDTQAWVGIVLIFLSGLSIFWREVVVGRKVVVKHPMPRHR